MVLFLLNMILQNSFINEQSNALGPDDAESITDSTVDIAVEGLEYENSISSLGEEE